MARAPARLSAPAQLTTFSHDLLLSPPHPPPISPQLTILFPDRPLFSVGLLGFMWAMCVAGIALHLTYFGPFKTGMQVSSYIGMGWAALLCIGDIFERLGPRPFSIFLLVGGGIGYTGGVPFFIKDKRTLGIPDHTIWHIFVMIGSAMHYYCVLLYLVDFPFNEQHPPWQIANTTTAALVST